MRAKKATKFKSWLIPVSFVLGLGTVPLVSTLMGQVGEAKAAYQANEKKKVKAHKSVAKAKVHKAKKKHQTARKGKKSHSKKLAKHHKSAHGRAH